MSKAKGSGATSATYWERATLGCLLERPRLLREANLNVEDFLLSTHREIYCAMCAQQNFDITTLAVELVDKAEYIAGLIHQGYVVENFDKYIKGVRQNSRDRQFRALHEQLIESRNGDRLATIERMRELLTADRSEDWRSIFHTLAEFENSTPLSFAISGFLPCDGITLIGGLSGHGKTLIMLAITTALLTGDPLFSWQCFSVPEPATRVLYLIPESSLSPFWSRLQLFQLQSFLRDDRLLVRTLSHREQVNLEDSRILHAARDAHVLLDTCARFMSGGEDAEASRAFANTLFRLLGAGARTVIGAHHAPKAFQSESCMTLEGILRGSGDLGALCSAVWGVRQINSELNTIFVDCVKARDFEAPPAFVLEGRPHLNETGSFKMLEPPGRALSLKHYLDESKELDRGGRPPFTDRNEKAIQAGRLRERGLSLREIAAEIGISKSTCERLLVEFDSAVPKLVSHGTEVLGQAETSPVRGGQGDGCGKHPPV